MIFPTVMNRLKEYVQKAREYYSPHLDGLKSQYKTI